MAIKFSDLPRKSGVVVGRYRVRVVGIPGVSGGSKPLDGREVMRLASRVGASALVIEPWDAPAPAADPAPAAAEAMDLAGTIAEVLAVAADTVRAVMADWSDEDVSEARVWCDGADGDGRRPKMPKRLRALAREVRGA